MDVVCGFIEKNNKVLLARRPLHKNSGGLWEFPGGKVQEGESLEEALARELREELCIETCNFSRIGSVSEPETPITLHALRCDFTGSLRPQEHMALTWVSLSFLEAYKLCPSDVKLIKNHRHSLPPRWFKEF